MKPPSTINLFDSDIFLKAASVSSGVKGDVKSLFWLMAVTNRSCSISASFLNSGEPMISPAAFKNSLYLAMVMPDNSERPVLFVDKTVGLWDCKNGWELDDGYAF